MKKRLNNALDELDERLIQEAAEAERLESNAPKIMRRILIPTGAAAAAGLCVFALTNRPDKGGVSLSASSSVESSPAVTLPVSDPLSLPESIPLAEPTLERAQSFGTKIHLLYADNDTAVFTDFSGVVYYKDLGSGEITFSADVDRAIIENIGADKLNQFTALTYTAVETETGEVCAALILNIDEAEEATYIIDRNNSEMNQEYGGFTKVEQEQLAVAGDTFGGMKTCSNVLKIDENKFIGMTNEITVDNEESAPQLVIFSLDENGRATADIYLQTLGSSYLNSLSTDFEALPDVIELAKPSREYAEEIIFGSEFPTLIYADDSRIVFTDIGRCVYIYDRQLERIAYSANVYETLQNTVGEDIKKFEHDCWNGICFSAAADGSVVISFTDNQSNKYTYSLDESTGTLHRLADKYDRYLPERPDDVYGYKYGLACWDSLKIGENEYVGITFETDPSNGYLRMVKLAEFTIINDNAELISEKPAFTEDYFNCLEMADKNLCVYRLGQCEICFNTADNTFTMRHIQPIITMERSGSFAVSGDELILTISQSGLPVRFRIEDELLTADIGEQETDLVKYIYEYTEIPNDEEKLQFSKAYGCSIFDSLLVDIDTAEISIAEIIKQCYADNNITGFEYNEETLHSMSYPLGDPDTFVSAYNGYDEWRGGNHDGIDIAGEDLGGADIYAPLDGTVISVSYEKWNYGMGKYVILDHGNGLVTVYAHCNDITVTEGQQVSQGEVIATVGSTGFSTGNHLHFEIRSGGEIDNAAMDWFTWNYFGETNAASEAQQ